MNPIPAQHVMEVEGVALRADPESVAGAMMAAIDRGQIVLVRGFFDAEQVRQLRNECTLLRICHAPQPVKPVFRRNGADLHNPEVSERSIRAEIRALLKGTQRRRRRFHGYKMFLWNRHIEPVQRALEDMVALRNRLYGAPADFATGADGEFFTMACVQHYRKGGGFLTEHSDADFHVKQGLNTRFEMIGLLSKKGEDYQTGGLFVRVNGERFAVDDRANAGDLVIYDVKRPHGVAPIDPRAREDNNSGRWIVLVPPFRADQYLTDQPYSADPTTR